MKERNLSPSVGTNTANDEAGMYVDVTINGRQARVLVDTGATVSLISHQLFYAIEEANRPCLSRISQQIISASGTPLEITGKAMFSIAIGKIQYQTDA